MLPNPTDEQRDIIAAVQPNTNILINAVAGSGKTTTNLLIAQQHPEMKILLLTYNNHLRRETKERAEHLSNIDVHTFHSFAAKMFGGKCYNDTHLSDFLRGVIPSSSDDHTDDMDDMNDDPSSSSFDDLVDDDEENVQNGPSLYNIVIIDEAQDLTPILFKLCKHIIKVSATLDVCVIILGDFRQNIYGYAGADYRYMKFFHEITDRPDTKKVILPLKQSWRLTGEMTDFINNAVFGGKQIIESPSCRYVGVRPKYVYDECWKIDTSFVFNEIKRLIHSNLYKPDDIFVLAPSCTVKAKHGKNNKLHLKPIVQLANKLSEDGLASLIRTENDGSVSLECLKDKIVFSSFHQAKGRERKVVFLLGFDISYFEFYNKSDPRDVCNNPLYVALTRAKELLYIINYRDKEHFKFVDTDKLVDYCDIIGEKTSNKYAQDNIYPKSIVDYLRNIPSNRQAYIVDESGLIDITEVPMKYKKINSLPCETIQKFNKKKYTESVADINGTTSTILCEYIINGKTKITDLSAVKSMFYSFYDRECAIGSRQRKKYNIHGADKLDRFIEELLRLSLVDICAPSGSEYRLRQVNDFTWADSKTLMTIYARLRTNVICHEFEEYSGMLSLSDHDKTIIHGRYDILSGYRLYEIKTVDELSNDHFMQVILYDLVRQMTGRGLEDARSRTEVAIAYIEGLKNDLDRREEYRLGDPVTHPHGSGFIYEFVKPSIRGDEPDVKIIDQHGTVTRVLGQDILPDIKFFDDQIQMLKDDIVANKFRSFLYNVRSNEMYEVSINDLGALYNYLSSDFEENVDDDKFILRAKEL